MPRINLTKQGLEGLKVQKRTELWDARFPGFGVRVSAEGHKAFILMLRQDGRLRRLTLGSYPEVSLAEARSRARAAMGQVAQGVDPGLTGVAKGGLTYEDLAEQYLELYARRKKRSWTEDQRILGHDILPAWRQRLVAEIHRRDVIKLLDDIVRRGAPVHANRTRALISRIFTWALKRELIENNPCAGVDKPTIEKPRERVLTTAEIRAVWADLRDEDPAIANGMRLLLITAQRSVEVRTMAWSQIDGDHWEIPGEVTKNGRSHLVPISRQARAIMESCRQEGCDVVLGSPRLIGESLSQRALSHAARRMVKRLGFQFTPHDLRRTAATLMGALGVDRFIIARLLNHTDSSVTGIYDRHRYWNEKLAAVQLLGDHIESIVGPIDAASLAAAGEVH